MQQIDRIEWTEEMTTEVPRFDSGHKKLLESVMSIIDSIKYFENGSSLSIEEED
jgi:hypothetical protein